MKIAIPAAHGPGYIDVGRFNFPDGQPHVRIPGIGLGDSKVELCARIGSADDLISVLLVEDVIRANGRKADLFITYLLGARMDRRIDLEQPFTLEVVARMLRGRFEHITVLDPHSPASAELLGAATALPLQMVKDAIADFKPAAIVAPDAGATDRASAYGMPIVQCLKSRDSQTGTLTGFRLADESSRVPEDLLIVDDICDGGRTFSGIAQLLRAYGAKRIGLYVTHGIFSKGFAIEGIDVIYTTTSYRRRAEYPDHVKVVGPDLF